MTITLQRPGPCFRCGTTDAAIPFVDLATSDGTPRSLCTDQRACFTHQHRGRDLTIKPRPCDPLTLEVPEYALALIERRCHWIGGDSAIVAWCESLGVTTCPVCAMPTCAEHMGETACVACSPPAEARRGRGRRWGRG